VIEGIGDVQITRSPDRQITRSRRVVPVQGLEPRTTRI
jgi:hypothetical protein